ncbi:MAG: IMP cyclohydrolase [archaeon]|nr:IMP cyclohydrolase [archaeon]MCP8315020.1 IMP cyclohydrolase [archaeon]MCP8315622.1 IMP cyclohydrolase [archaeon]MCP8319734.1 IMP cyclohydrolase [archaeon]
MPRGTDVTNMTKTYRTRVMGEFPLELIIGLEKESDLRYGENPNQPGSVYRLKGTSLAEFTNIHVVKEGKGGLSAINFMDVTRALDILKFFDAPSVAVMKHNIPSGFATQFEGNSLDKIYALARDSDARSAFGSVVVLNRPLDIPTAEEIIKTYVECVAAPGFKDGTIEILGRKKDIRAVCYSNLDKLPKFVGDDVEGLYDIKILPTGRAIVQKPYLSSIRGPEDLVLDPLVKRVDKETGIEKEYIVERNPTQAELRDLLTAWYVNIGVRSNGIVFVKNGVTVAISSGQQERVGAVEHAIIKAYQKAMNREKIPYDPLNGASARNKLSVNPLEGAVISSDAFFPFRDSIDLIARAGVTAIIQPGGSLNDHEVIEAVNEYKMAMVYTLERCFGHF